MQHAGNIGKEHRCNMQQQ